MSQMFPCLDMHNCRNNNRCKFAKIHNITFYFLFTFDKTILQLSCDNTYNLGCVDSCAMVTLPIVFPTDGHYTLYFSGTNNVKITVSGVSGEPILLDATLLNANSIYTFYIQNTSGVRQLFEIGEVEYDCFKIKIDAYFSIDATEDITPTQPCTLMCQETYDPMHESKDIFDYNNLRVKAVADGTTITGDGTAGNPFVAIGGGGGLTCADLPICPIIISMANDIANKSDIGHTHTFASLTSKPTTLTGYGITDAYPLVGNPSAFIDATALLPYLTIASASATYQPILVSGTNIKTINGSSVLGAGDLTISGLPPQSGNNGKYLQTDGTNASWQNVSANVPINTILSATGTNTINNANYKQTWQWNSVTNGGGLLIDSNSTSAVAGEALVEIKRSGAVANYQKTVTLKLSNAITSISGNNPIALEIETIGGNAPIGINFKPSPLPTAIPINLENSLFGTNTGINMGNQFVKFGGGGFTGIGTDGSSSMRYNCNGGQHTFGTTGSSKVGVYDYVFGSSSPFTINRRTASPANDWELMFGGQFNTPSMLAHATEANSIRANAGVLSFAGDTGLTGGWTPYTPTYIMSIHGGTKNVGIGTTTPHTSAILDLVSTTKGLSIPTMTSTQASAIASPKKSLMLYVTDTNGTFTSAGWWGYNGTVWKLILAE